MMSDESYVVVFTANTELNATLYQAVLAENGVKSVILTNESNQRRYHLGALNTTPAVQLVVAPEQAELARQLLIEYEAQVAAGVFRLTTDDQE